jgi:GDSL-like Lipase/Acylhydrolase family
VNLHRRAAPLLAVLLLGAIVVAACSGAPHTTTVPPETKGPATLYVALGGDDNRGDRNALAASWPQLLFRTALPETAVFVNLSNPRSGAADILAAEIPIAIKLHPDIVTITILDDAERGTDPAIVEHDLTDAIHELRAHHTTKILLGTIPDTTVSPATTQALNHTIEHVATDTHVQLVDLQAATGATAHATAANIAHAFARALHT